MLQRHYRKVLRAVKAGIRPGPVLILVCLLPVAGCGLVKYKPEPLDAAAVQASVRNRSLDDPDFLKYDGALFLYFIRVKD